MSKVKSVIVTALLIAAIIVAAFFATISFPVSTTKKYNSMASSIHLGSDLSGSVYTTLYPEGVVSAQDYNFLTEEEAAEYVVSDGVYVKSDVDIAALKQNVQADAEILNARFGQKGYSGYSVAVEDGLSIKISVPSNYTYAAYKGNNSSTRSEDLTVATSALTALTADGELTLRTTEQTITTETEDGDETTYKFRTDEYTDTALVSSASTYVLTKVTDDVSEFFKSISSGMIGATPAITLKFTDLGREKFNFISTLIASSESQTLYFFVGDTLLLSVSCTSTIDSGKMQLQAESYETAQNCAIVLDSAVKGQTLNATYNDLDQVISSTASSGDNAALFAFIACLVILVLAIALLIARYKKLGVAASLVALVFALVMVYALFLLEIQLTLYGVITAVFGLILLLITNITVFEEVRKHTAVGKTIQASVKSAYRGTLLAVADIHIVLFVAALLMTLVGAGEVAACGFIMIVATIASYVLYWFTRFLWYVMSSPVKDKFRFGGYKRVVYDD